VEQSSRITSLKGSDRVNILVVDDQPAKLLSYEVILAETGATLIKASSACEAFECLLKSEVALILIDVCMPDVDGFELAELIRDHPRFQRIAIIFVSAVMNADVHRLRGYELGALDYITVPIVPELLRAKVTVFVDLYRKTQQLKRQNAELEQRVLKRTAELRRCNKELERRIEERTREREVALAELVEAQQRDTLGQLAVVTHDFNNLLMAVLGSLTLLEKRLPEDAEGRRLLHNATQGARRGAALTQCLLAFSRRRERKPISMDVGELVGGMEKLLKHALGFAIGLTYRFHRSLPPVLAGPNQLELALLHVALNARDAMPQGGRLTIGASSEANVTGMNCALPLGQYVCMRIIHHPAGIDEAGHAKPDDQEFGTESVGKSAVGLTVARAIAAQLGGALRIETTAAVGTTVQLWLPVIEPWSGHQADDRRPSPDFNGL
jgi:DNA-binding response OmpR family regulator